MSLSWWSWVNENASGLVLFVTSAGVIVAGIYAFLTHRLASSAEEQARTAAQQTEVLKEQADATRVQAAATREQADITRRMFESGNRPSLSISSSFELFGDAVVNPSLVVRVKNHGSVPAKVEAVALESSTKYDYPTHCPFHVFPGEEVIAGHMAFMGVSTQAVKIQGKATVTYMGPTETRYQTVAAVSVHEALSPPGTEQFTTRTVVEFAS